MFLLLIFLIWWPLTISSINQDALEFLIDYGAGDDPKSDYDLLFGKMTFENFFGPNIKEKQHLEKFHKTSKIRKDKLKEKEIDFLIDDADLHQVDDHEYNHLTKTVNNMTRRYNNWPDEEFIYHFFKGYEDPYERTFEQIKRQLATTMGLQYLVHTRVKIYAALKKRALFKHDKRYRLGYMFYRLRRILYDMAKFTSNSYFQEHRRYYVDFVTTLRWYQRVMRLDVDLKDTIKTIKVTHIRVPDPEWRPPKPTLDAALQKAKDSKNRPGRITIRPNKKLFTNLECYRNT